VFFFYKLLHIILIVTAFGPNSKIILWCNQGFYYPISQGIIQTRMLFPWLYIYQKLFFCVLIIACFLKYTHNIKVRMFYDIWVFLLLKLPSCNRSCKLFLNDNTCRREYFTRLSLLLDRTSSSNFAVTLTWRKCNKLVT
jgi:hypothetical protein